MMSGTFSLPLNMSSITCSIFIPEGQVKVMGWRAVNDVRDHLISPEYVSDQLLQPVITLLQLLLFHQPQLAGPNCSAAVRGCTNNKDIKKCRDDAEKGDLDGVDQKIQKREQRIENREIENRDQRLENREQKIKNREYMEWPIRQVISALCTWRRQ